jgi:hypothetical protein
VLEEAIVIGQVSALAFGWCRRNRVEVLPDASDDSNCSTGGRQGPRPAGGGREAVEEQLTIAGLEGTFEIGELDGYQGAERLSQTALEHAVRPCLRWVGDLVPHGPGA